MFSAFKRPVAGPNAVIYSYEVSKLFLDSDVTSVLEVGCGIGNFVFRYASARKNVSVVGIDYSAKTIEYLSANYGKYYENLQLKICDFCEPAVSLESQFDAIYSSDVLEHVTDTKAFVDSIYRHLGGGRKAVVNFPNETNHGINHFNDVEDVRKLFGAFSDVKVFMVNITHPVNRLWFATREVYENLFSRSTKDARRQLYSEREEQGIDRFEDSTCFTFINDKGKFHNRMASLLAEAFLLVKPSIDVRHVERGTILNSPRIVVVATK